MSYVNLNADNGKVSATCTSDAEHIKELEAELADGTIAKKAQACDYWKDKAERLEAELDQCLTAHAKLNDECERLKGELVNQNGYFLYGVEQFNAGMERAAEIVVVRSEHTIAGKYQRIAAEAIRKEIKECQK